MLDLVEIAKEIEDGLNRQMNDPNIVFKIWANAGEHSKPLRSGNEVTYFIDGELRPTGSENLGTIIDMGSWALTLTFLVPIPPPRTGAAQTANSLQRITDDQYEFFSKIAGVIDAYFAIAENITVTSAEGVEYSVGIRAGFSIPGTVDLYPSVGEASPITAYITLGYVEGGINSRRATVAIDTPDNVLPTLSAELSRANVLSSDVYAGDTRRQSIASASALGLTLQLPLTEKTGQIYQFLVEGGINIAHFIFYTLDGKTNVYWMTPEEPVQASSEASNVGLTVNFVEIVDDEDMISLAKGYRRFKAEFDTSEPRTFWMSFRDQTEGVAYVHIGSHIIELHPKIASRVDILESDYIYDPETQKYYLYAITSSGLVDMNTDNIIFDFG